jgi:hypothetical protein
LVSQLPAAKPTPYETVMALKAASGGDGSEGDFSLDILPNVFYE